MRIVPPHRVFDERLRPESTEQEKTEPKWLVAWSNRSAIVPQGDHRKQKRPASLRTAFVYLVEPRGIEPLTSTVR